jgi:tRNA dimethylallyltransferase
MKLCIAILGPTASGKSEFALELAKKLSSEIVCMDSATVYRGLDIGSSKPTLQAQKEVPHHLLDILDPEEGFSAFHFVEQADLAIQTLNEKNKIPLVVGGTYFYLRALQHGMYQIPFIPPENIDALEKEYFEDDVLNLSRMHSDLKKWDPASAEVIHPNDRYRLLRTLAIIKTTGELPSRLKPAPRTEAQSQRIWIKYALCVSRNTLNQNIVERTEKMIQEGLIEETRKIWEKNPKARALQNIGYQEAVQVLQRKLTEKQIRNEIIEKTRQLAKRQITWLRSDSEVRFIDKRDVDRVILEINNLAYALKETPCNP